MKTIKLLLITVISLLAIQIAFGVCTVTFFKEQYYPLETITATMICSDVNEKNTAYTLNWTNSTGFLLEADTGTTPVTVNSPFYQTYTIPSTFAGQINGTLIGTNLEGNDSANVSGSSALILSITDIKSTPKIYIGEQFAMDFKVTDNQGLAVSNAQCVIYGTDNSNSPLQICGETQTYHGRGVCGGKLDHLFIEGNNYLAKVRCSCQNTNPCINENGNIILNGSSGSIAIPFNVSTWINVNTVVDQTGYHQKEEIVICANTTNVDYPLLINTEINYAVRCSAGIDNYSDLDRVLVVSDNNDPDKRGIPTNSTRMQCKRFVVPEPRFLQGKSSQCFASTYVYVRGTDLSIAKEYRTDSPYFNITLDDLNIQPDWQRINNYEFNAIINLSSQSYSDYNATISPSNLDIRLDKVITEIRSYEQDYLPEVEFNNMLLSRYIKNWSVNNITNNLTNSTGLEINEDGNLELEVRNVDITQTGYYNVTIYLHSFEERQVVTLENQSVSQEDLAWLSELRNQTKALEDIANKTGTFHFDIDCPDTVDTSTVKCTINAYLESGEVQKEVSFNCYVDEGVSSQKFNSMITATPSAFSKEFSLVTLGNTRHTVTCKASYYNLGSRTDSFSDSFNKVPEDNSGIPSFFKKMMESGVFWGGLIFLFILFFYKKSREEDELRKRQRRSTQWSESESADTEERSAARQSQ